MDLNQSLNSLIGGGLIGLAVSAMMLFNGRVTGISGILSSSLTKPTRDGLWRWLFIAGLIAGGFLVQIFQPDFFTNDSKRDPLAILVAGFLVGYGTVMGSGCTSGHGICGISRLSIRSFIATLIFMFFGFLTVQALRVLTGGSKLVKQNAISFAVGFLFAIGLAISGMTQPQKIIEFLNPWDWNSSLLFVMIGALGVHIITYPLIRKRASPVLDNRWFVPTRKDITTRLIIGSALFGVGWGLGGFCPGPGLTSLATGDLRVFLFVASMVFGMFVFKKTERFLNWRE
jgi:uncharacterized protein